MSIEDLPTLNAILNSIATVLIVAGLICIFKGRKKAHMAFMISALVASTAFLTSYVIHKAHYPSISSSHMPSTVRGFYLLLLISHVILAIVNLPMIIMTVVAAIKRNWEPHKKRARWTVPIWLYVSVTGVIVYFWIYHWYPAPLK